MKQLCLRIMLLVLGTFSLVQSSTAFVPVELFVANAGNNSITVYGRAAGGNAAPLRIISGNATQLWNPKGVAVDTAHSEIVVSNEGDRSLPGSSSITVYAWDASGNVAPKRTITGDASGIDGNRFLSGAVAVDPMHDEIFAGVSDGLVKVWSRTANGNAAPLRTLQSYVPIPYQNPEGLVVGLAVDTINDELIVAAAEDLYFFPRSASGAPYPRRYHQGISYLSGVALNTADDEVAVTTKAVYDYFSGDLLATGGVLVIARNFAGQGTLYRYIYGDATGFQQPSGIAIDPVHNELLVSNPKNNSITVHARSTYGDFAPLRILAGPATGLNDNVSIALGKRPVTSQEYVQVVYVAYYGRPADPAGQDYWAAVMDLAGGSPGSIIAAFGNSDEFNRRYGGLGATDLVTKIYQQALGRVPDPAGFTYYVGELIAGKRTLQTITLDLLNGATSEPDSIVIANKLVVAAYYTALVRTGCPYGSEQEGADSLAGVTADPATVVAAKAAIDARCGFQALRRFGTGCMLG